jgi:mannose-6-phosphate isomerase-like protein (cupin superfamily)
MEVISPADRETVEPVENGFLTQMGAGERMSIQHFRLNPDAGAPRHSHEHEQVGYLVEGTLTIVVDEGEHSVEAGDAYLIPSSEAHAIWNRGNEPAVGVETFSPPRPRPPDLEN